MRALGLGLILVLGACNPPFEPVTLPAQSDIPADQQAAPEGPLAAPMGIDMTTVPQSEQSLYVALEDADLDPVADETTAEDDILAVAGGALAELEAQDATTSQPVIDLVPDQATASTPEQTATAPSTPPVPAQDEQCPEGAPYLYKGTMYCGNFMGN